MPRPNILDIVPYVPGDSTAGLTQLPAKLSSNESALGPSPEAIKAFRRESGRLARYPDGSAAELRACIGLRYGLDPGKILCSNGSEQLIAQLARAYAGPGDEILFSEYGFFSYRIAALAAGATPVAAAEREFTSDVDALLRSVTARTKVLFLANPNNPTGTYISANAIRRLRTELPKNILLVLDQAYGEYVDRPGYAADFGLADTPAENVVILRTFSKIYGLAALRVGWGYLPESVADVVNRIRGAFNVNAIAQATAIAALADTEHIAKAKAHNDLWLPKLTRDIRDRGFSVTPGVGNFLLLHFAGADEARAVDAHLRQHNIILRPVGGYGLPQSLRLTIGSTRDNEAVMATLALWERARR